MTTRYKGKIGEEDLELWDGEATTFTRKTSTGGSLTLTKVGAGDIQLQSQLAADPPDHHYLPVHYTYLWESAHTQTQDFSTVRVVAGDSATTVLHGMGGCF